MSEDIIRTMLDILRCPISKGELTFDSEKNMLYSKEAKVFYPIKEGILVLLVEDAIPEGEIKSS